MDATEACKVYNELPEPHKLTLRDAARQSLQEKNLGEIGTSDVSNECFSLIISGECWEILGYKQCSDCKEWFEELPEGEVCQSCYAAGSICPACNGSGEGSYDGSTCRSCGGSGDAYHPYGSRHRGSRYDPDPEPDYDDRSSYEMDQDAERASNAYESRIMGR
jgi:hypothetical protein